MNISIHPGEPAKGASTPQRLRATRPDQTPPNRLMKLHTTARLGPLELR